MTECLKTTARDECSFFLDADGLDIHDSILMIYLLHPLSENNEK